MEIGIVPFNGDLNHVVRKWRYDVLIRRLPAFGHKAGYFRAGGTYDAAIVSLALNNEGILSELHARGIPVIGDVTDDILSFPYSSYTLPGKIYYSLILNFAENRFRRSEAMLKKCRALVVGSRVLRDRFSPLNPHAAVIVDAVTDDIISLRAGRDASGPCRIGWFGNVSSLHGFREMGSALDFLAGAGGYELRLITSDYKQGRHLGRHPRCVQDFIKGQKIACRWIAWNPETFLSELADCHIGIVPVDSGSRFTQAKPSGRALLMMGMGLPIVASPVDSHLEVITEGVTGYIARTGPEWAAAIEKLRLSADLRKKTGDAAAGFVKANYSEKAFAEKYAAALNRLSNVRQGFP